MDPQEESYEEFKRRMKERERRGKSGERPFAVDGGSTAENAEKSENPPYAFRGTGESEPQNESYEEFKRRMKAKDRRSKDVGKEGGRSVDPFRLIVALCSLGGILLLSILSLTCFARSALIIGNVREFGETENVASHIFGQIELFRNTIESLSSGSMDDIGAMLELYYPVFRIFSAGYTILVVGITLIMAIARFFSRNATGVTRSLLRQISYLYLPFALNHWIANTMGGEGESYYFSGYETGVGFNVGMILALIIVAACAALSFFFRWKRKEKFTWNDGANLAGALGNTVVCAVLSFVPLSPFFQSTITAAATLVAAITQNTLSYTGILNVVLVLILFFGIVVVARNCPFRASAYFLALIYGETQERTKKEKKKMGNRGNVTGAILCACLVVVAIVLEIPFIGMGTTIPFLPSLVVCFILFVIACAIGAIARKKTKVKLWREDLSNSSPNEERKNYAR